MPAGALLLLEHLALNDLVNESSEAIVLRAKFGDDGTFFAGRRPVGKPMRSNPCNVPAFLVE